MKKVLTTIVTLFVLLSLISCGGDEGSTNQDVTVSPRISVSYINAFPEGNRTRYTYNSTTQLFETTSDEPGIEPTLSLAGSLPLETTLPPIANQKTSPPSDPIDPTPIEPTPVEPTIPLINQICGYTGTNNLSATLTLTDRKLEHYVLVCSAYNPDSTYYASYYNLAVLDKDLNILWRAALGSQGNLGSIVLSNQNIYYTVRTAAYYPKNWGYKANYHGLSSPDDPSGYPESIAPVLSVANDGNITFSMHSSWSSTYSNYTAGDPVLKVYEGDTLKAEIDLTGIQGDRIVDWMQYKLSDNEPWKPYGMYPLNNGESILLAFHGDNLGYNATLNRDVYIKFAGITIPTSQVDEFLDLRYFSSSSTDENAESLDCTGAWSGPDDVYSQQSKLQCDAACVYDISGVQSGVTASCNILINLGEDHLCSVCQ